MAVTRYYRQREQFSDAPDVYLNDLPPEFRIKVAHCVISLIRDLGQMSGVYTSDNIDATLRRHLISALGLAKFSWAGFLDYFCVVDEDRFFVAVEVVLHRCLEIVISEQPGRKAMMYAAVTEAAGDIDTLLRYHKQGWGVEPGESPPFWVIPKQNEHLHQEVIQPTLRLLSSREFAHVNEQYREAFNEYQDRKYEDAITDAASAFESFLKVILDTDKGDATDLLKEAVKQGFVPPYLESSGVQLVKLMQALPITRNELSDSHGRATAADDKELERHVRLTLNLAAAFMLYFSEA